MVQTVNLRQQVKEVLLTPIVCQKTAKGIYRGENVLYTGQQYCRRPDPDMSDLAVGFYQIVYREIFEQSGKGILCGKYLTCSQFCGDTMNSYKAIAKKMDTEERAKWHNEYHCLANFWLLPLSVGRSLRRLSKAGSGLGDYMDKFLRYYLDHYKEYRSNFPEYAKEFSPESFGALHFLGGIYINEAAVIDFSSAKDPGTAWEEILWEKVEKRAELIAYKKGPELYEFFSGLGIIDTQPPAC